MKKLFCAGVVLASLTFASFTSAQVANYWDIKTNEDSIRTTMSSLLVIPQVQSEIGLTRSQVTRLLTRIMLYPMQSLPTVLTVIRKQGGNSEEETVSMGFESSNVPRLSLDDLTGKQKLRLRELALQADALTVLRHADYVALLGINPKQNEALKVLLTRKLTESKSALKALSSLNTTTIKALFETMSKLQDSSTDESEIKDLTAEYFRLLKKVEADFAKMMASIGTKNLVSSQKYSRLALEVLNPEQRAKYRKLSGKIVTGWPMD